MVCVFGTLLGPGTTGPLRSWSLPFVERDRGRGGLVVAGFPHMTAVMTVYTPLGVWVVVVVCGLGLLFENYIVNASIFKEAISYDE